MTWQSKFSIDIFKISEEWVAARRAQVSGGMNSPSLPQEVLS